MLNWLAGQRSADTGLGERDHDDAPDTPAPVFAVRAFKHAIFGTPATAQSKPRRNSAIERDPGRASFPRATRPTLTRPKSAGDAGALTAFDSLPASPTKGILLTPGTAGGRGKSVTFGGLQAEDFATEQDGGNHARGVAENNRGRNKKRGRTDSVTADYFPPADKFETAPKSNGAQQLGVGEACGRDCSTDASAREPQCGVGRYWKHEYDIYREKTADEVRKLITKQRAAKSFAREKDEQCSALTEELKQERGKVQDLERKSAELEAQVSSLKAEMERLRSQHERAANERRASPVHAAPMTNIQEYNSSEQHKHDTSRLERSLIATEIRARRGDRRTVKLDAEQPLSLSTTDTSAYKASRLLASLDSNTIPDNSRVERVGHIGVGTRQRQDEPSVKQHQVKDAVNIQSPTIQPTHITASDRQKPYNVPAMETLDKSMLDTVSKAYTTIESKENVLPLQSSPRIEAGEFHSPADGKRIFSRDGDTIPPDRIAAARARLAARRQARPNNGVRAVDSRQT